MQLSDNQVTAMRYFYQNAYAPIIITPAIIGQIFEYGISKEGIRNYLKNKTHTDITYQAFLNNLTVTYPKEFKVAQEMLRLHRIMKRWKVEDTYAYFEYSETTYPKLCMTYADTIRFIGRGVRYNHHWKPR